VAVYDADGRFSVVNDRIVDVYDSTPEELIGRQSPLVARLRERSEDDPFAALVAGDRETCLERSNSTFPSGPTRSSTSASSGSLSTASSTGCSASPA